jgi:hypothetical protein
MTTINTITEEKKFATLLGQYVFVDGWQYDNYGVLLDGIITSIEAHGESYGRTTYKVVAGNQSAILQGYILQSLVDKGSYTSNKMLNSGTDAVLNPKRQHK